MSTFGAFLLVPFYVKEFYSDIKSVIYYDAAISAFMGFITC